MFHECNLFSPSNESLRRCDPHALGILVGSPLLSAYFTNTEHLRSDVYWGWTMLWSHRRALGKKCCTSETCSGDQWGDISPPNRKFPNACLVLSQMEINGNGRVHRKCMASIAQQLRILRLSNAVPEERGTLVSSKQCGFAVSTVSECNSTSVFFGGILHSLNDCNKSVFYAK